MRRYKKATISVGWTSSVKGRTYNTRDVMKMINALRMYNIVSPVSFTLRAGPAANSYETIWKLLNSYDSATLSLWASKRDKIDLTKLNKLVATVGPNRVYYSVPQKNEDLDKLTKLKF